MPDKRTYWDRAEYLRRAVTDRRRRLKKMLVDYRGGKCAICNYDKCPWALDFHHVDPKSKSFGLSVEGLTQSVEALKKEADKCIVICANCHREVHSGLTQIPKKIKNKYIPA